MFVRIFFYYLIFLLFATVLLMIPQSWVSSKSEILSWDFFNSLFTVVSAFSTTGLIIFDTGTDLSFLGQFIILILMIIGGFSLLFFKILIFQTIRQLFFNKADTSTEFYEQHLERGYLEIKSTKKMLKIGLIVLFSIELIGFILLFFYFFFHPIEKLDYYNNFGQSAWSALFHSISATNNAGFDIFNDGISFNSLETLSEHYFIQIVFIFQFLIGGLGLPVFLELWEKIQGKFKKIVIRKRFTLFTKFSLFFYLLTIFGGLGFIMLFEFVLNKVHTFSEDPDFIMKSIFNTLSTRSAGFSTVDIKEHFTKPSRLMMVLLMWIGCSPLSTGGGIKVTTLIVIFLALFLKTDAKNNLMIGKRSISSYSVNFAYRIAAYSIFLIFFTTLIGISNINFVKGYEDVGLFDIIFESTSAFGNVGLASLNIPINNDLILFKIMIFFSMLIGQIGIARTIRFHDSKQPKGSKITLSQNLLF